MASLFSGTADLGTSAKGRAQNADLLDDPAARSFVLRRNPAYERRLLAENATHTITHGPTPTYSTTDLAGLSVWVNAHASALPGGQVYLSHGVGPHQLAASTNPYTHECRR